jgi:hypothetical protein
MARRYQIIKKTTEGVFRAHCDTEQQLKTIVEVAKSDPKTKYVVVKDRYLNRRGLVWRRTQGEEVDWWILQEPDRPDIEFKKKPRI